MAIHGLNQIQQIAVEVFENSDNTVALRARVADKLDPIRLVCMVVAPEIVGVQEKEYASASLITHARCLFLIGCPGQEQPATVSSRRRDNDPAFVLLDGSVLEQGETEFARVEGNRFIII